MNKIMQFKLVNATEYRWMLDELVKRRGKQKAKVINFDSLSRKEVEKLDWVFGARLTLSG
jgi:hypothetical protein